MAQDQGDGFAGLAPGEERFQDRRIERSGAVAQQGVGCGAQGMGQEESRVETGVSMPAWRRRSAA